MTDGQPTQDPGLVKLRGAVSNYRCARADASFVFDDGDRTKLGVVAIAAGIAGLSGQAISTAASATGAEEQADYVEFDLDDKQVKGWVWRSPFKEGDVVEVAAEWSGDHYEAGAIARPADRIIALYPHCSRGTGRHVKNAIKWWILGVTGWLVFMSILILLTVGWSDWMAALSDVLPYIALASFAFFGLMTASLARRWMPFVRLTEKLCRTLGLPEASDVDLVKFSKARRRPEDPGEFGTFYFRY